MTILTHVPWKDPRLAIGVILIAGGGVAGSILLGGESSVPLLRASAPIAEGSVLSESQFVVAELPERVGKDYVRSGQIPDGAVAAHGIEAGDLLPSSAIGEPGGLLDVTIPLIVAPASSVAVGSQVDVWRVQNTTINTAPGARLIAQGAVLVSVEAGGVGAQATAQIRVEPADVPGILEVLGTQDGLAIVGKAG